MPQSMDLFESFDASFGLSHLDISTFAEDNRFCGKVLYPRQRLLLKLFFLEDRTDYEERILDHWINGGAGGSEIQISPHIRERIDYLRSEGYKHFREITLVGGRRSSKGFLTGIALAKVLYDTLHLQNPNEYYGLDPDKEIYFVCMAASESQAKEMQFADFASTVNSCEAMQENIHKVQEREFSVNTQADLHKMQAWQEQGRRVQRDISKLRAKALPANARTARGYTIMGSVFDELAHWLQGESDQSDSSVFDAVIPSMDQFGIDALAFNNSSPYTKIGKLYERYEVGMAEDNGLAAWPESLAIRFPSWAQPLSTQVLTPRGWCPMELLQQGDQVIGRDGSPTTITGTNVYGEDDVYRVTFSDGQSVECSKDHLWNVSHRALSERDRQSKTLSTLQLIDLLAEEKPLYVPTAAPVRFNDQPPPPIPAYSLGAVLGDGNLHTSATPSLADFEPGNPIAVQVQHDLDEGQLGVRLTGPSDGVFRLTDPFVSKVCATTDCERVSTKRGLCNTHYQHLRSGGDLETVPKGGFHTNSFKDAMRDLGLLGVPKHGKFIPQEYQTASIDDRFALLQGLLDTDGEMANKGAVVFYNSAPGLIRDFRELVEGLGGTTTMFMDERRAQPGGRVSVRLPSQLGCPFRMPRKVNKWRAWQENGKRKHVPLRRITTIEFSRRDVVKCISVAADDGLYVTEHGIVTHNSMFEGWWDEPAVYYGAKKCITVSPDWNIDARKEDGSFYYTQADRQAINIARHEEAQNPTKYKVERRGQFAEVIDAYLEPRMVDRMFAGKPVDLNGDGNEYYEPLKTNWDDSSYLHEYRIHIDPSSTTAGFGFCLAHTEEITLNGRKNIHVVVDILKRWDARDFPNEVIDWHSVLDEIYYYINIFRPREVTMDQFSKGAGIQMLREKLRQGDISETRLYESTATLQHNWDVAEIFKTAVYQNLVHAPFDIADAQYAMMELKYLQEIRTGRVPRVEHQEMGPVQTSDMFDTLKEVVSGLIGNLVARQVRHELQDMPLAAGSPGGFQIGDMEGRGSHPNHRMREWYKTGKVGEQRVPGNRSRSAAFYGNNRPMNPARGFGGGRPGRRSKGN